MATTVQSPDPVVRQTRFLVLTKSNGSGEVSIENITRNMHQKEEDLKGRK